jgi:serine/threonine protein kinase
MHGKIDSRAVYAHGVVASQGEAQPGRYRDIASLGRGGMGDVHLCVGLTGENKLVVIKRLRSALASDADFLQTFLDEARTAACLHHANIAQTQEVGFDGHCYFIAREYLDGQPMSELIRRTSSTGGLPLAMQLRVLCDALGGLHHAHEQKAPDGTGLDIVHGDFSPSNIFVLYDGTVKVVDFGIAKTAYSGRSKADIFKGKIRYIAPEHYASCPIDRRADIYSAGVILWEAATQRRMGNGLGDLVFAQRVAAGDIPLPSSIEPGVPKRLEAICMRALAVRPEDRYATAAAFRAEIVSFLADLSEPLSAHDVGSLAAEISADRRSRLDELIAGEFGPRQPKTSTLSLAPTVTSPRIVIHELLASERGLGPVSAWRPRLVFGFATAGLLGMLSGLAVVQLPRWPGAARQVDATAAPAQAVSLGNPRQAASPAHVPTSRSTPIVPATGKTRLRVETVPSFARIGIDGSLLPVDVHDVVMVNDHAAHRVWAEAPGYQSRVAWVRLEDDQTFLKLTLIAGDRFRSALRAREMPRRNASATGRHAANTAPAEPSQGARPHIHPVDPPANPFPPFVHLDATDPWKK